MPDMRHAAGPEVKTMKIELRRLHRAFSHLRSLFLPLRIVKQSAFDSRFFSSILDGLEPVRKFINSSIQPVFAVGRELRQRLGSLIPFTFRVLFSG